VTILGELKKERERERSTEASGGAELGSVNGVVVGENVGAVYASGLDRMVGLGVEHCVYFAPTHFPSLAKLP
jgi:hypothetical protein